MPQISVLSFFFASFSSCGTTILYIATFGSITMQFCAIDAALRSVWYKYSRTPLQSNSASMKFLLQWNFCFNEIFPIPLQPATPFNATNSSPQQTICLGCSHFRNFRWLGLKFLLIEAGFEHLFYNKISLKPAFCSFLIHSGPLVSLVSLKTWAVLPNHKQACTACLPRLDATLPSQRIR